MPGTKILSHPHNLIFAVKRCASVRRVPMRIDLRKSYAGREYIEGAAIEHHHWRPIGRHADQGAAAHAGF